MDPLDLLVAYEKTYSGPSNPRIASNLFTALICVRATFSFVIREGRSSTRGRLRINV
jgi:hypothetical protein